MIELNDEMRAHLRGVVDDLVNVTQGKMSRDELAALVNDAYEVVAGSARIADFLPMLTERYARTVIRAKNLASGAELKDKPEVLVLCEQGRGRSQAGAALFRFYAPGELNVESAGCRPGENPNSRIVAYLREHGVRLTDFPKPFTEEMVQAADHVLIVGDLSCPLPDVEGQDRVTLPVADPEMADTDGIAAIMADVDAAVRGCISDWLPQLELHERVVPVRSGV